MAITIQERPYEISWSKNQIRYILQTGTHIATEGLAIEVRLMFRSFGEPVFEQVYAQPCILITAALYLSTPLPYWTPY